MSKSYSSILSRVGLSIGAAALFGAFSGCGDSAPLNVSHNLMNQNANAGAQGCDVMRIQLRHQAIRSLGLGNMLKTMKLISQQISEDERADLGRITQEIDRPGFDPATRADFIETIQGIYFQAAIDAGLEPGVSMPVRGGKRAVKIDPSVMDPLPNGHAPVLVNLPLSMETPKVGEIAEIYLTVDANQRQDFMLMQIKSVSPGPNNGYSAEATALTLDQYIDSKMPARCTRR